MFSNSGYLAYCFFNIDYRLDGTRPDLTKLDSLLGLLSSESTYFPKQVMDLSIIYQEKGVEALIQRILEPPQRQVEQRIPKEEKDEKIEKDEEDVAVEKPRKIRKFSRDDVPPQFCCPIT